MRRDSKGDTEYWNKWVVRAEGRVAKVKQLRNEELPREFEYEPQYVYDLSILHLKLMLGCYSRGDDRNMLSPYFPGLLDAWGEAESLGEGVWSESEKLLRRSWGLNLHYYVNCFWLVGLALVLEIQEDQWHRLLLLIGNEGEDVLLDRVIASRQVERRIGDEICFPKAYKELLKVIDAPASEQPALLRSYVESWFVNLKDSGSTNVERYLRTPYWYTYGDENFEGGTYFGRWCIEAVAVAKAFGIDDSLCLDHPNYPGDLLRDGRSPRYEDEMQAVEGGSEQEAAEQASVRRSLWRRLFNI